MPARLAPEIVGIILGNVTDKQTLVACRLVSKSVEAIGARYVWRKLRIVKPGPSSNPKVPFEVISKAPHISPYVKEIEFDVTNVEFPDELLKNIPGMLGEFSYFHNFKRLEALCLVFPSASMEPLERMEEGDEPFDFDNFSYDDDDFDGHLSPQRKVRTESFKMLGRIHLEHGFTVPALTIRELHPVPHTGMHAEGLLSFMKSLRKLSIAIPEVDPESLDVAIPEPTELYEAFRKDLTPLLGAARELRTFEYEGDEFADGLDASQWDSLTFPRLESLHLRKVSIRNDSPDNIRTHAILKFILRHRATLKQLHLGNCTIDVQSKTLFTWREVFDIFSQELKNLRQFTFLPVPDLEGDANPYLIFSGYTLFDRDQYWRRHCIPYGYDADALMLSDRESLQALQRELDARQSAP
ncbi:hypothetical protein CPC08DRAFT_820071 [Agrocybe pediades]|nr:hypothetical protein CPC08DRAFT_820071 [Agrocybe pediades]